ncbi:MAG TPA: class IV adenylate cyclase [Bryobacteraceae bacterium]|nr:class IV adenylate cyclase [Bryobacteraceae bacterium]
MPVETEIKLRWPERPERAVELLQQHGFAEASPRQLEIDQVFDLPDQALRRSGQLLRLRRRGSDWILTYKGPPRAGPYKSREEIETELADGAAFEAILAALGYSRTFRYEKYRTKFVSASRTGSGLITLDETPIGSFLELEGPEYWIDETAAYLGFTPDQYVTSSYATLYHEHLAAHPEAPSNMTF